MKGMCDTNELLFMRSLCIVAFAIPWDCKQQMQNALLILREQPDDEVLMAGGSYLSSINLLNSTTASL